jgi:amino acid transporter
VAVVAIVFVEILVCIAVIMYFNKTKADTRMWHTKIAPVLALIGLLYAEYLLMSRFGVLAGTAAEGIDPTLPESAWALNTTGWILVGSTFVLFIVGALVGQSRKSKENVDLIDDLIS